MRMKPIMVRETFFTLFCYSIINLLMEMEVAGKPTNILLVLLWGFQQYTIRPY